MWVKSEYAGALAVFSTWVCGLLPWSVTIFREDLVAETMVTAVWIRFLPGRFLYVFGLGFSDDFPYRWVWQVPEFVATRGETLASYAWIVGTVIFLVAFLVSLLYYAQEQRLEASRVDPVRLLGGLLVLSGVALAVAAGLLWRFQAGVTVPVGVVFELGLGAVLLRVERT